MCLTVVIESWVPALRTDHTRQRETSRDGFSLLTPTYLLPLLSSHLPFLLFVSLIPYKDLLDTFWCILGTKDRQNYQ